MRLSIIVAMDKNRLIGKENGLPWHLPADLQYFKKTTMGKTVLMGRKTYESLGKPLPSRRNIVVSHNQNFMAAGCEVVTSTEEAVGISKSDAEVMVIGGACFYQNILPSVDRLYITEIEGVFTGDIYFPEFRRSDFVEIYRKAYQSDEKNLYNYNFTILERQ